MATLSASVRELGVLQPILVRPVGDGPVRADRRRAALAGGQAGRAHHRPGPRAHGRGRGSRSSRPWWRTSTVRTSTPSRRRPPTSSSSRTSGSPTRRWPPAVGRSRADGHQHAAAVPAPSLDPAAGGRGQLSAGHARALLGTPDRAFQEALARRAVDEGLSVRAVEEAVRARNGGSDVDREAGHHQDRRRCGGCGRRLRPPGLLELEELLSGYLDTRVAVEMGGRSGARSSSSSPPSRTSSASTGGSPTRAERPATCPPGLGIKPVERELSGSVEISTASLTMGLRLGISTVQLSTTGAPAQSSTARASSRPSSAPSGHHDLAGPELAQHGRHAGLPQDGQPHPVRLSGDPPGHGTERSAPSRRSARASAAGGVEARRGVVRDDRTRPRRSTAPGTPRPGSSLAAAASRLVGVGASTHVGAPADAAARAVAAARRGRTAQVPEHHPAPASGSRR